MNKTMLIMLSIALIGISGCKEETKKEEVKTEIASEQAVAKFKAQAADMNYKKSNDIISIKAYRKSLQIKVKEVKLC